MVTQVPAGSLDPQSPSAEAIADLWWFMLALGTVVFVLVMVLLAVGLFRRRATDAEGWGRPSRRFLARWVIGGGVVLPLVGVLAVFVATVLTMRAIPSTAPADALVIEVVGSQWEWEIRYPEQGISTVNELHLPVGRPVALELTSADVIHSFWVPPLGGKRDLLPDGTNTLVLEASEPGRHLSHCAEFCGLLHAEHQLVVVAEPPEQFETWVADQRGGG